MPKRGMLPVSRPPPPPILGCNWMLRILAAKTLVFRNMVGGKLHSTFCKLTNLLRANGAILSVWQKMREGCLMLHICKTGIFQINFQGADRCCQTLCNIKGNAVLFVENCFGAAVRSCKCPLRNSFFWEV